MYPSINNSRQYHSKPGFLSRNRTSLRRTGSSHNHRMTGTLAVRIRLGSLKHNSLCSRISPEPALPVTASSHWRNSRTFSQARHKTIPRSFHTLISSSMQANPPLALRSGPLQRRSRSPRSRQDRLTRSDNPQCPNSQELRILPIKTPHLLPHPCSINPRILSPATSPINPWARCKTLHSRLSRLHKDHRSPRHQPKHNKTSPSPHNLRRNFNNNHLHLTQSRLIEQGQTLSRALHLHLRHPH